LIVKSSVFYLPLGVLLVLIGYHLADLKAANPHPAATACDQCHLAREEITVHNAKILVAEQEQLCRPCHQNAVQASHPSGIQPSMHIPDEYPLDWKGELTCSTCHDIHGSNPGLARVKTTGRAMCMACHDFEFFARMKDGGTSIMVSGHLDARRPLTGDIDAFSIHCMSCHESRGDGLSVRVIGNVIRHSSGRDNHPVGVPYQRGLDFGGYRPVNMLPAQIALPNGKVSCISCHHAYTGDHGKLVMDNAGSRLCYSCHDL
jgi:predicted CXXCH cytochrome family protein